MAKSAQGLGATSPDADPARTWTAEPSYGGTSVRAALPRHANSRYVILGEHGRGGLGRVSRVHDRELGRDIAIKELLSSGHISELRFIREALITARLEHPGIVPVYEAGRWEDGTPFYAMKLISGQSLRDLLAERKAVAERIGLLHHVIAVADALAYAHGRGIIHRDLKPANVIVGDFGETVVIDWGLAKDLSVDEELLISGRQSSATYDGLTSTGSVLGTPAYMAPEQARGEPVDRRADVFAIGAMLWELCSVYKVPPGTTRELAQVLRSTGIDSDLIAIIAKALDPDPARRYPDAGLLAADLKAFKAGARIAARHYSPWEMIAHWVRRHRLRAVSLAAISLAALIFGIIHVRRIAAERDRTARALQHEAAARSDLELEHAALLLHSDPTAAAAALAECHGGDALRCTELLAEAHGRGVAREVVRAHNDTVYCLSGQPDGSFVSVAEDYRVRRTNGTKTRDLAANVSYTTRCAFSSARRLLAYAAAPNGLGLIDFETSNVSTLSAGPVESLTFATDDTHLAALDKQGTVSVWSTAAPYPELQHASFPDAKVLRFVDATTLAIVGRTKVLVWSFSSSRTWTWDHGATSVAAKPSWIALGQQDGTVVLHSPTLASLASIHACKESVQTVEMIPEHDLLAVGCSEGMVAILRVGTDHAMSVVDTFRISGETGPLVAATSGTDVLATGGRTTYIYNVATRLVTRLEGHANDISAVAAPSPGFPDLLTADVNGTVRQWEMPAPSARQIAKIPNPFAARFSPDSATLAVFGQDPAVHLLSLVDGRIRALQGHREMLGGVRYSHDGSRILSFSWDGTARVWRPADGALLRTFTDHHAVIEDAAFTSDGTRVVTIGDDGGLFVWRPEGDEPPLLLFRHNAPLISLEVLATTNDVITRDAVGALWVVGMNGNVRQLRQPDGVAVTSIRASMDGRVFAFGQENGAVTVYRTSDWTITASFAVKGNIARIAIDPLHRDVLVQSEDGIVRLWPLSGPPRAGWRDFTIDAHDIAYDPSGDLIAISAISGGSWFYSMRRASWAYLQDHMTELWYGHFSPDGQQFVTIDALGSVVARDVSTIFAVTRSPSGS